MSTDEQQTPETDTEDPGEPGGMSERTAKAVLLIVALLVMWGIVAALPEAAYVVVGVLGSLAWQKARARWGKRTDTDGEDGAQAAQPDVGEALRRLVGDDKGVLLTALRDDLKLPNTKAVKALLDAEDIPWKAVRTREGNGPAVHRDAIPPAPSSVTADAHADGCCCRSSANANTNNGQADSSQEGFRVVPIGTDGRIIYDRVQHHTVRDQ